MEGLTLPCSIAFKCPRMALPCQSLVFNALSGLVVVAKLLTEAKGAGTATHQTTATHSSSMCRTVQQRYRDLHT